MTSIIELLDNLADDAPAVVDIPGTSEEESIRCYGLFVKKDSPHFELLFHTESWGAADLKLGADCRLSIEHNGLTFNLIARLDAIVQDGRLSFTAKKPISPEELRDFFRVAITTPVEASYKAGSREVSSKSWKMLGATLDLSGSGVLAVFDKKPPSNYLIQLVITVPEEKNPIVCLANVIRSYRIRRDQFQVAFYFESISPKTRDSIISCCLQEQRRQLRDKVQII